MNGSFRTLRASRAGVALAIIFVSLASPERRGLWAAEPGFIRDSFAARDDWTARNLAKLPAPGEPKGNLRVLANNDPVICNNRGEQPLRIAGKAYSRGLYCHAVSKVLVRHARNT